MGWLGLREVEAGSWPHGILTSIRVDHQSLSPRCFHGFERHIRTAESHQFLPSFFGRAHVQLPTCNDWNDRNGPKHHSPFRFGRSFSTLKSTSCVWGRVGYVGRQLTGFPIGPCSPKKTFPSEHLIGIFPIYAGAYIYILYHIQIYAF